MLNNKKLVLGILVLTLAIIMGICVFVLNKDKTLIPKTTPPPPSVVNIIMNKTRFKQGEKIEATLDYKEKIYYWDHGFGWSVQKWQNNTWATIKIKEDPYFFFSNTPDCNEINLEKIENCPPTVVSEKSRWYEVTNKPKLTWNQLYKIGEKTFQCKTGKIERVETWPCVIFGQVPPGKHKIRFEYVLPPSLNDPFSREVGIDYAEKEFVIQ
jgi:hypothetical protein